MNGMNIGAVRIIGFSIWEMGFSTFYFQVEDKFGY